MKSIQKKSLLGTLSMIIGVLAVGSGLTDTFGVGVGVNVIQLVLGVCIFVFGLLLVIEVLYYFEIHPLDLLLDWLDTDD